MKSFMEFVTESASDGLYAAYKIAPESAEALVKWAKEAGLQNVCDAKDLHITTVYSKKNIKYEPSSKALTVTPKELKILGHPSPVIVLAVESPELHKRFAIAKKAGATWDYPSYIPHITLTGKVSPDVDITGIKTPTMAIETGPEYTNPLSD